MRRQGLLSLETVVAGRGCVVMHKNVFHNIFLFPLVLFGVWGTMPLAVHHCSLRKVLGSFVDTTLLPFDSLWSTVGFWLVTFLSISFTSSSASL